MSTSDTHPLDITLITAMTARHSLADLLTAHHSNYHLNFAYYPNGLNGKRKYWRGVPSAEQIALARTLLGVAMGRDPVQARRYDSGLVELPADRRSPVGTLWLGYERVLTYKWTTPADTRKPLPPQSYAWRDTKTGALYLEHPFIDSRADAM